MAASCRCSGEGEERPSGAGDSVAADSEVGAVDLAVSRAVVDHSEAVARPGDGE